MKNQIKKHTSIIVAPFVAVAAFGMLAVPFALNSSITAQSIGELREKSEKLEKEINDNTKRAEKLRQRGNTLSDEITRLDKQVAAANEKIAQTDKKIKQLQRELDSTQTELDRQKELLKASMRALYKRGDASTVELLVGSDSFSQFIDEQEYLERLKIGVQDSADKVIALKQEIEARQNTQKDLMKQQIAQRELVKKAKAEQARLLAETKGLESLYRERTAKLEKQQAKLLSEIVARSRVLTGVGNGSYPWADFMGDKWSHVKSCSYGNDVDPWGYCYRQCTSFVAWRLYSDGKKPPEGYGNAENWDNAAKADGKKTGSKPKKGALAVWEGAEGHVAFVEEILADGQVRISEYNAVPALKGKYSQRIIAANDPSVYIYY